MTVPTRDAAFENFSTDALFDSENSSVLENVTLANDLIIQVVVNLNIFYTPFLIILGSIGNLVSLVVFYTSKLRMQSMSQYLSALALSDTLFLLLLIPPWLKALGASTLFSRAVSCKIFVYLSYVACNLSSWLVVAFTVERFVAVIYPLKRNIMCTGKRARMIIVFLAALALGINIPVIRLAVSTSNDCNIDEVLIAHAVQFNAMDTAVSFTVPLAVIVLLNIWIMVGFCRLEKTRRALLRTEDPFGSPIPQAELALSNHRFQQRVTKMLLMVSSTFVFLNLPGYAMRLVAYAKKMGEHEYVGIWAAIQQVCLLCFNTNFGINFALYCLSGRNFRRALRDTFTCLRRPQNIFEMRTMNTEQGPRTPSLSTSFTTDVTNTGNNGSDHGVAGRSGTRRKPVAVPWRWNRINTFAAKRYARTDPPGRVNGLGRVDDPGRVDGPEQVEGPVRVDCPGRVGGPRWVDGTVRADGPAQVEQPSSTRRRRGEQRVIKRWRFDNSRQLRQQNLEMQQMPDGNM